MKKLFIIFISVTLVFGQVAVPSDSTKISEEELFLQEIAEQALENEKKRKNWFITAVVLIVVYTLVDYYLEQKDVVDN